MMKSCKTDKFIFHNLRNDNSEQLFRLAHQLVDLFELQMDIKFSQFELINDPNFEDAPITCRKQRRIYVSCPLSYSIQFAYQTSHELCHFSIPNDVCTRLRWFEEVLAVLSSILLPLQLPNIDSQRYLDLLNNILSRNPPRCVKSPVIPDQRMISFLERGSGTDNFNDYGSYFNIGLALLPIIQKTPVIWKAVPYLNQILDNGSFETSILEWQEVVPSDVRDTVSVIVSAILCR